MDPFHADGPKPDLRSTWEPRATVTEDDVLNKARLVGGDFERYEVATMIKIADEPEDLPSDEDYMQR